MRISVAQLLVICAGLLFAVPALSYPPAPSFTFCGVARDAYGWALGQTDGASVIITRGGEIIAEAPIDETVRPGENFRVAVPMDLDAGDTYTEKASFTGDLIGIQVRLPSGIKPVASLTTEEQTVGEPAGKMFIDFSIGTDVDEDLIPDSWEYWQLEEAGISPTDPAYSLTTFGDGDQDHDGRSDYEEYLAGTFAFLQGDVFELRIEGIGADGWSHLRADVVVGKSYYLIATTDFATWQIVDFALEGDRANLLANYTATETTEVSLEVAPDTAGADSRVFRAVVR